MAEYVDKAELKKVYDNKFMELQKLKQFPENKTAESKQLGVNYCINILEETPPADVQPVVHAKWDSYYNNFYGEWCYTCTNCEIKLRSKHNYCPNCGAKMDKE